MSRPVRNAGLILVLAVLAAAAAAGVRAASSAPVSVVAPGEPVEASQPGTVLELAPGRHAGFEIATPRVTVRARPGAVVAGEIRIVADGVRLEDLTIDGSENGVTVRGAEGIVIDGVWVRRAGVHGIEVNDGAATIRGCRIEGLTHPYAQGIEVRNADLRPRSRITGCAVSGGLEGIVTHVARVEVRDVEVSGTTGRGIAITEMSQGLVEGSRVEGTAGAGLYCSDVSLCTFRGNTVRGIAVGESGMRSEAGHGAVALYYSTMRLEDNRFEDLAGEPVHLAISSSVTDGDPLRSWPPGWRGALPAAGVAAASLAGIGLVALAVRPAARRLAGSSRAKAAGAAPAGTLPSPATAGAIAAGLAVQTFHMVEHAVQVFQVYVAAAEERRGLLGAHVDSEWLHFGYNALVLACLAVALGLGRRALGAAGATWLLAAVAVQTYHVAEHVAKIAQHLATAVNPAPGLWGGRLGLVWFHFGINLAVYAATLAAAWHAARRTGLLHGPAALPGPAPPQPPAPASPASPPLEVDPRRSRARSQAEPAGGRR